MNTIRCFIDVLHARLRQAPSWARPLLCASRSAPTAGVADAAATDTLTLWEEGTMSDARLNAKYHARYPDGYELVWLDERPADCPVSQIDLAEE